MQKNLSTLTDKELQEYRRQLDKDIAKYNNLQLAKKVSLNSAYGALG
jgi:DNA polymerase elongation subunit (family B)